MAEQRAKAIHSVLVGIYDYRKDKLRIESGGERPGYLGTAVVAGRATEVVDCAWWLRRAGDGWFGSPRTARRPRLLVVEDSAFFRNMLVPAMPGMCTPALISNSR